MIRTLVLSGGELKGFAYIGMFQFFEEHQLLTHLKSLYTVSVGSIFGLAYCLGMSSVALKRLADGFDLHSITDIDQEALWNMGTTFGVDSGKRLSKFVRLLLKHYTNHETCTFQQLHNAFPQVRLHVVATNISKRSRVVFSVDHTPHVQVEHAIRVSCGLPVFFQVFRGSDCYVEDSDGECSQFSKEDILVDGALSGGLPMDLVSPEELPYTLAIKLESIHTPYPIDQFHTFLYEVFQTSFETLNRYFMKIYSDQLICIRTEQRLMNFDFSTFSKADLIETGYQQVKDAFLNRPVSEFRFASLVQRPTSADESPTPDDIQLK
jgi:predicted acylesterase/phospholipase RssA